MHSAHQFSYFQYTRARTSRRRFMERSHCLSMSYSRAEALRDGYESASPSSSRSRPLLFAEQLPKQFDLGAPVVQLRDAPQLPLSDRVTSANCFRKKQ